MVVRASCVAITKIMMYKNGSMTKYAVKIMEALTLNFKKQDPMVSESSFGCFANLVRHVPDNKKFATLHHIHKLVTFKDVNVRCYGWRIAAVTFERILGLKKARPTSWWQIAEQLFKAGKREKSKTVLFVLSFQTHFETRFGLKCGQFQNIKCFSVSVFSSDSTL